MKLWAYRKQPTIESFRQHSIHLYAREFSFTDGIEFLGTIDLDIQKPKKTVVREAKPGPDDNLPRPHTHLEFCVPDNAKNIKCTYEIEE